MSVCGIVVAGGTGSRMGMGANKALLDLGGEPVFMHSLRRLRPLCDYLILVTREDERHMFQSACQQSGIRVDAYAGGGRERRHSVENALALVPENTDTVLVHDAARPFPPAELIREVIQTAKEKGAAVPAIPVADTLRKEADGQTETVSRDGLFRVQTPQGFRRDVLMKAYADNKDALTDDAGLVERSGVPVTLTRGDAMNFKITEPGDFLVARAIATQSKEPFPAFLRVGTGYDVHRLAPGRALILCGVNIPFERGLLGHSDADVALHALMDALLGAAALGDIGRHFPDSDAAYKGVSSMNLLEKTKEILNEAGFAPLQADLTIVCQKPRLAPYMGQMRGNVARALGLPDERINVKATTTEGLGFEGEGAGISAQAAATVMEINRQGR